MTTPASTLQLAMGKNLRFTPRRNPPYLRPSVTLPPPPRVVRVAALVPPCRLTRSPLPCLLCFLDPPSQPVDTLYNSTVAVYDQSKSKVINDPAMPFWIGASA